VADPLSLVKIWQGGLVFYGGFLGAVVASWIYTRKRKINFFRIADLMIPSVAIGHVFGRLGCFTAGCCHGAATGTAAYGAVFHDAGTVVARNRLLEVPLHPTQLYEATGELIIFFVLILWRNRKHFNGQLLVLWLILYPILRSIVEMFRGDYERGMLLRIDLFGSEAPDILSTSQLISLLLAAGGIALIVVLGRLRKQGDPPPAAPQTTDPPPGAA
jgi:phosphatidylglycerol:prolipoprotein diacylglycerol transferase